MACVLSDFRDRTEVKRSFRRVCIASLNSAGRAALPNNQAALCDFRIGDFVVDSRPLLDSDVVRLAVGSPCQWQLDHRNFISAGWLLS